MGFILTLFILSANAFADEPKPKNKLERLHQDMNKDMNSTGPGGTTGYSGNSGGPGPQDKDKMTDQKDQPRKKGEKGTEKPRKAN